jgi:hypothetical protein
MIRNPDRKTVATAQDDVDPNLKGVGEIAQEFYMKMSLSPQFINRQQKILNGQDADYTKALNMLQEK